jgi:hypothetical protein
MAELVVDPHSVTVVLSAAEKLESIHGDLTVPRSAVRAARAVEDGMAEIHGLRAPGTGVPGVIMAGTFHDKGVRTFAVCHHHRPAVVLELDGEPFDRVVVTVANPQSILDALG